MDGSNGQIFKYNYYCYNCKNELFFRPFDTYNRDLPPFRFHKLLVKKLEKKADDWKTERKTTHYYAFCCKCAKKNWKELEDKETVKESRWTKRDLGFEIEKCDCQDYIFNQINKHTQSIINYNNLIADAKELLTDLDKMRYSEIDGIKMIGDETFRGRSLIDFIKQLEIRIENNQASQSLTNKMLEHVENQQVKYKKMFEISK